MVVKNGIVVQSIGFNKYLPVGRPEIQVEYFTNWGVDEILIIDIDATKKGLEPNYSMIKKVSKVCYIPLTVGGGISSIEDARNILCSGADKVGINTMAIEKPELITEISERFGIQCCVVAIDAKRNENNMFEVFSYGARKSTGIDAIQWSQEVEKLGAGEILLTSMDRDGTKKGYDLDLTKKVSNLINIPVIASGGVGNLEHLHQGFKIGKASAVLAASIFHFGEHTILEAKQYLDSKGIPVRI